MELHYVYYAVEKKEGYPNGKPKYGATENPSKRCERYLQWNLVEAHTCPWKAGDREIELQIKQFGKRDNSKHYAVWKQMRKTDKFVEGTKKGGQVTKERYTKVRPPKRTKEESNELRKATLRKRHTEGRWKNWDKSFFQKDEYKEKLRKSSLKMWKDPKRKEAQAKGPDNSQAVLSADDVRFIRKTYFKRVNQYVPVPKGMMSLGQLVDKFKCDKGVILKVVQGKTYTSVK